MKVKLRDMTYNQYRRWREENCSYKTCKKCVFNRIACGCANKENCWVNNKNVYSDEFLDQEIEIDCEAILSEEEREYLSNIIKPFRDRVEYIEKYEAANGHHYLSAFNDSYKLFIFKFCLFSKEEYKGLESYKRYTLEELGL